MKEDKNQLILFGEICPFTSLCATFMAHLDLESRRFLVPKRAEVGERPGCCTLEDMGVSKNGDTQKWMVYSGKFI